MPLLDALQLPSPANWQDFETLCWDLWRAEWKDPNAQKHGRPGQKQHGVDIFGQPNGQGDTWEAVQCKLTFISTSRPFSVELLRREVTNAKAFSHPLTRLIVATNAPNDGELQAEAARITQRHRKKGSFAVIVLGWDEICRHLSDHILLVKKHYPQFFLHQDPNPPKDYAALSNLTPCLPTTLVVRDEVMSKLKRALLDQTPQHDGSPISMALVGMPGVGKSILATQLANDPQVKNRFPDGVLWATLGQQPDILPILLDWIPHVGGSALEVASIDRASGLVRGALTTRRYLVVIDDAWTSRDVEPFRVCGPNCSMLLTTRNSEVARSAGAEQHEINVFTPEEALELFSKSVKRTLADWEIHSSQRLVTALEFLPLAIAIAAMQVADGMPVDMLLAAIEQEVARLETLDLDAPTDVSADDSARKLRSIEASFSLSLRNVGEDLVRAFAWLGALPEDAIFGPAAAQTIWGLHDAIDATLRLIQLRRRALLEDAARLGSSAPRYRLHDLLHDFARRLLTGDAKVTLARFGIPAYGMTLEAVNAEVVRRYQTLLPDKNWGDLPYDGYIHEHLTFHMEHAGQLDNFFELLHQTDCSGRNSWFQARERIGQIAGFVSDLERFRCLVLERSESNPLLISRALSASVMQSSLVSRAHGIHDALAVACVHHRIWTPAQGLGYARLKPAGTAGRAWMLAALAPFLGDQWLTNVANEAFADATAGLVRGGLMASLGVDERALELLLPLLPTSLKLRLITLSAAAPIRTQARMALQIAAHLKNSIRRTFILDIVSRCAPSAPGLESDKVKALVQLAKLRTDHLGVNWDITLLRRAQATMDAEVIYTAFKGLAPLCQKQGQVEILRNLEAINSAELTSSVLLAFDDNLTEENRALALHLASNLPETIVRHWVAGHLTRIGNDPQIEEKLATCIKLVELHPKDHRKFKALHDFLVGAPPSLRQMIEDAAIEAAAEIGFGALGALPLQQFARDISVRAAERMADMVVTRGSDVDRRQALPALLARVPESRIPDLCQALLLTLRSQRHGPDFSPFADRIPKELLPAFLLATTHIGDEGTAAEVIVSATPFAPTLIGGIELRTALKQLYCRSFGTERSDVAVALLHYGPSEGLFTVTEILSRDILTAMADLEGGLGAHERTARSLQSMLALLPEIDRTVAVHDILKRQFSTLLEYHRELYLAALVTVAPPALTDGLLVEIAKLQDPRHRANLVALRALANDSRRTELFRRALFEASAVEDEYLRFAWIERWASHLPIELGLTCLAMTENFISRDLRQRAFLITLPLQPANVLQAIEPKLREIDPTAFVSLGTGVIRPYFLSTFSAREWRIVAEAYEGRQDFARFVLCLQPAEAEDLYSRSLASLPVRRPLSIERHCWMSFGIAAANLPTNQLHQWLVDRISALAVLDRASFLSELEFLWPILDKIGGAELTIETLHSIILAEQWWP